MPPPNRLVELTIKHLEETISTAEEQELAALLEASPDNKALFLALTEGEELDRLIGIAAIDIDDSWKKIEQRAADHRRNKRLLSRYFPAAAVLLLIGFAVWWGLPRKQSATDLVDDWRASIPTGPSSQYLLLADGRRMAIDSLPEGPTQLAGTLLIKKDSFIRIRQVYSEEPNSGMTRWYASRKRYRLTLPDSSETIPEDSTSLQFPASLGKGDRIVFITGKAYFHVNDRLPGPFITALSANALLPDPDPYAKAIATGTSYYVNAMPGKGQPSIVLHDGQLTVKKGLYTQLVQPGETIILPDTGKPFIQQTALPAAPEPSPGGGYSFNNEPIPAIIATIQKKYKCAVRYKKVPTKRITLTISQQAPLSKAVEALRAAGCTITMKNDSLIIGN